jgi:hypothetical protein
MLAVTLCTSGQYRHEFADHPVNVGVFQIREQRQ